MNAEPPYAAPGMQPVNAEPPYAAPGNVPAFEINQVFRSFGLVKAVQNFSYRAMPGNVIALVGPNGCGKSTLMLMLAGLLAPNAGTIRVNGLDPLVEPAKVHSLIGWMPDQLGAWDNLTVREVLEVIGQAHFLSKPQIQHKTHELLEKLDLVPLANQPAQVLSRGQKQRLGLARALMHDPKILILDEPASGLDPAARRNLFNLVRGFAKTGGTVLISSHILSELEEMADEIIVMDSGQLVHAEDADRLGSRLTTWKLISGNEAALVQAIRQSRFQLASFIPADDAVSKRAEAYFQLSGQDQAQELLKEMVMNDAQVVSFAPAAGALETIYLSLDAAKHEGRK